MKLEVSSVCEGHALCVQTAPEVFELGEDGYAFIKFDEVPTDLERLAELGARVCPVAAVVVER
jgi:ferredoxin